jgi:hypothetical protein
MVCSNERSAGRSALQLAESRRNGFRPASQKERSVRNMHEHPE